MSAPNRRWSWEDETSEFSVTLDDAAGLLRWGGNDKRRPGVPAHAMGGGGVDQPVEELLQTGRPAYVCPQLILDEVLAATRAWQAARPANDAIPAGGGER